MTNKKICQYMSINNTFTTIKKFLTTNLSCDNIFICLGDVAQLARASGSYPLGGVTPLSVKFYSRQGISTG